MRSLYPAKIRNAVDALLTQPAISPPPLRRAVEAYAARLSGAAREAQVIPAELTDYVNKVTLHAYKVTDQDVQGLRQAGYSEDAIFEITLCASVGASLARLESGLKALKGDR
jgi:hypothetical protein